MILHTVNKSPFTHSLLLSCIDRMNDNDGLILLEDGVFAVLESQPYAQRLKTIKKCYAISDDILARGLTHSANHIQLIDYNEFVDLCCKHQAIKSWY